MAKKETYISEAEIDAAAENTGKTLAKQEKVAVMIAPTPGEKMFKCIINGYSYAFPRGEMVEVPKSVANLIADLAQDVKVSQAYVESLKKGLSV